VWLPAKESHGTASQESPTPLPDGGLHQRVAFRTHPVQDESVEQPWETMRLTSRAGKAGPVRKW